MENQDDEFYSRTIKIIIYILGSVSIACLLLIIIVFLYEAKRKKTTPAFELIFNLSLSELIHTIAFIILYFPDFEAKDYNKTLCTIQGPLIFVSETSQHIMACMISFYILWINMPVNSIVETTNINEFFIENSNNKSFNWENRFLYISLCYGVTSVLTLIGLQFEIFGVNRFNCWIKEENANTITVYYACIWILVIINFLIAIKIYSMKFTRLDDKEKKNRMEFSKGLSVYPITTLICFFIFTVTNYLSVADEGSKKIINVINLVFTLLNGFFYAVISMYSFRFRKKIMKLIRRMRIATQQSEREELITCDINDYLQERDTDKETFKNSDSSSLKSKNSSKNKNIRI